MQQRQEFFPSQPVHIDGEEDSHKKNFLYTFPTKIFIFSAGVISMLSIFIILFILSKHSKLKTLVASLAMQQIRPPMSHSIEEITCECKTTWVSIFITVLLSLLIVGYLIIKARKLKVFHGDQFANSSCLYIFFTNTQYYVPIKICTLNSHMLMVKLNGQLLLDMINLQKNTMWDVLKFDWQAIQVLVNNKSFNLPTSVTIPLKDKLRLRRMLRKKELACYFMIKQGLNWYMLKHELRQEIQNV